MPLGSTGRRGLPSQWTTDGTGNVLVEGGPASFQGENGFGGLMIQSLDDNDTFDVFMIKRQDGGTSLGIDPFGFVSVSGGIDVSPTADVTVARFAGLASGQAHDTFQVLTLGAVKLRANDTGLGFFGKAPVAQPAAPVTLGDVIAALKALGLVAT